MAHRRALVVALAGLASIVPVAGAQEPTTGGVAVPEPAEITAIGCQSAWACETGQRMVVRGRGLDGIEAIEFLGGRGSSDDRTARPREIGPSKLTVIVPAEARSGRVRAITFAGNVDAPERISITPGSARQVGQAAQSDGVFPIRGKHDLGQTETNNFGGGRGHQGQDMFADCGTPLAAVRDTTVQFAGTQDRAGNYVVLQDDAGMSYVYMHMRDRPLVRKGDRLSAGERVGFVGETGRASGCHVHFEIWAAPGWYTGGSAIDPLPQLRIWEKQDEGHR